MDAFFQGMLAGYGIAIPVGAIAILIVELGLRLGFWAGFAPGKQRPLAIYTRFVGLTLLNPLTVAYFAALILGGNAEIDGWAGRAAFVSGAAAASLSWQSLLAATGALGHRHLSPGLQRGASLAGNLIVIGLGVRMLF